MKARINPVIHYLYKIYWWWITREYELDPEKITTFWEWCNLQDVHLARYELHGDPENHEHVLEELSWEETEAIIERYLSWRNRRQVNK